MVQVAVIAANVAGDIGGTGVSRMHFQRVDAANITVPDCNAAAAAWRVLWTAAAPYIPSGVTWSWNPIVTVIEHSSALVQAYLTISSVPANMVGTGSGTYPAGNGARLDWMTQSIHGRRFMRAANYIVPMSGVAYAANGSISATAVTAIQGAAATFLGSMATAQLELVSYGRPAKGTTTGGHVGLVTAARVPTQPATLRSRRK